MRLTPEALKAFAFMAKQYPDVLTYLEAWRDRELQNLPYAKENPTLSQGRCQVLCELTKLIKDAPSTHTG